jgi:hypothetical protein
MYGEDVQQECRKAQLRDSARFTLHVLFSALGLGYFDSREGRVAHVPHLHIDLHLPDRGIQGDLVGERSDIGIASQ